MLEDSEESAKEQLKRVDHLLHVTLKYSRTAEVIKNAIKRLIGAFDYGFLELLEEAKIRKLIKEIPLSAREKTNTIEEIFKKEKKAIQNYIDFYYLLREIDKADFKKKSEFRKGVTLITQPANVDINTLKGYYEKTREFADYIKIWIDKKKG